MNVKDFFQKITKTQDAGSPRITDVPKVVFDDLEMQVTIGQWLGLLSSSRAFEGKGMKIYAHLDAEELIKVAKIPKAKLDEIADSFGLLLKKTGVDENETCILSDFDKKHFSFRCHFNNAGDNANISLRWGSFMDSLPEFNIEHENVKRTYGYIEAMNDKPARFNLESYIVTNPQNGSRLNRYLSPYSCYYTLYFQDYTFSIVINRPDSIDVDSDSKYRLENEKELEEYLLSLTFPIKIDEVYHRFCGITGQDVASYAKFEMAVKKDFSKNETAKKQEKTTDAISLSFGNMTAFILTRNGKTVTLGENNTWSYVSDGLMMTQDEDKKISYSFNAAASDQIVSISPVEQLDAVNKEVEEVQKLSLALLKKGSDK